MKWVVTRQRYWPDGRNVVEVAEGGLDYANPDALAAKYHGELQEFADPREAVKVALEILDRWNIDGGSAAIAYGAMGGYSIPFDACTRKEALAWAEEVWETLPKCGRCGDVLQETWRHEYLPDDAFCSENCAENAAAALELEEHA